MDLIRRVQAETRVILSLDTCTLRHPSWWRVDVKDSSRKPWDEFFWRWGEVEKRLRKTCIFFVPYVVQEELDNADHWYRNHKVSQEQKDMFLAVKELVNRKRKDPTNTWWFLREEEDRPYAEKFRTRTGRKEDLIQVAWGLATRVARSCTLVQTLHVHD
jgi:hypothetical protein